MGKYSGGGRATTSGYMRLDVRYLQRKGFLRFGTSSIQRWSFRDEPFGSIELRAWDGYVTLSYRTRKHNSDEWTNKEYPVTVEWRRCHFGGERAWFRCPGMGCGRRAAILYGGSIFACRRCYNLAYDSQNETAHSRALGKVQAIRVKLGGEPCGDFPPKPRGMHWRTYWRWKQKADAAEDQSWSPWFLKMMAKTCLKRKP